MRPRERLTDPRTWVLAAFALAIAVGCTWALPGPDTWAADSISPRSCGLGAIAETYTPGHWHHYPPLQMAIFTVTSLPWMAIAASRVGTDMDRLAAELIQPFYMTGIEACARAVIAAMALATLWNVMRLWERLAGKRAGIWAGVVVAANAVLVYYAHDGNLEVPYLFWIAWGLVELDRVACGEPRERRVLLLAVMSVLTKDQAAGAWLLPLPLYLAIVPRALRGAPVLRKDLVRGVLVAIAAYALISGAVVNPVGFWHRVRTDVLGAGASWAAYPRGVAGTLALARDAVLGTTEFTSWPIAAAAAIGLGLVAFERRGVERARGLAPFVAALSFTLFFNLGARRSEPRFLLPQSVLFFPYAAVAMERAWGAWPRARAALAAAFALALAPAALGVASMDATLLADSRYEAERFLDRFPSGTHVEVYGGPLFLPRIPAKLVAVRPGIEPIGERQPIAGIEDIVDPAMDPRPRAPEVIVLATELSTPDAAHFSGNNPFGLMQYRDPVSSRLFAGLMDGSLGYERALRARCELPWPLACREIHGSTGKETWVYARRR